MGECESCPPLGPILGAEGLTRTGRPLCTKLGALHMRSHLMLTIIPWGSHFFLHLPTKKPMSCISIHVFPITISVSCYFTTQHWGCTGEGARGECHVLSGWLCHMPAVCDLEQVTPPVLASASLAVT